MKKQLKDMTLEDCISYFLLGYEFVLCDGGLIGVEKIDVGSRGCSYFSYSNKPIKR